MEIRAVTLDQEELAVYIVYEEGTNKEAVKADKLYSPYSKRHNVLVKRGDRYEFKSE
jgi:hypothetical protein